jgi:hypothetical protein
MKSSTPEMRPTHKFDLLKPQWSLDEHESSCSPWYVVIHKVATNQAYHKQSSKNRVQAASEGAIHDTSSRKESDYALGLWSPFIGRRTDFLHPEDTLV